MAEAMKAPAWYGPLCGLLLAALLLTPLIKVGWFAPVPVLVGVVVGLSLQQLYRRVVGITKRGVVGPRSTVVIVVTVGGVLALYCAASLFAGFEMPVAVAVLAACGFAMAWVFVVLNDRAIARDLRHAG